MIAFALLLGIAGAQAPAAATRNCDDPRSQSEMNLCASAEFERADDELLGLWPQFVEAVRQTDRQVRMSPDGRSLGETRLHEAQRAWIAYRDSHCAVVGYQSRGGSMEPMLYNGCRARLTRERIEQLRADLSVGAQ